MSAEEKKAYKALKAISYAVTYEAGDILYLTEAEAANFGPTLVEPYVEVSEGSDKAEEVATTTEAADEVKTPEAATPATTEETNVVTPETPGDAPAATPTENGDKAEGAE